MPFPSQEFIISEADKTFHFLCPRNPDDVLNAISDEQYEKDKFLPYWTEHWPSAQVLFPFILKNIPPKTLKICEMGCGLGIISAALNSIKQSVVSIDISPYACIFSYKNICINGGSPKVVVSDWRAIAFKTQFDLIVASDILYEERWIEPVLSCIKVLLKKDGKAWIADPCRRFWNTFKKIAVQNGFSVNTIHEGSANEGKVCVEIVELQIEK